VRTTVLYGEYELTIDDKNRLLVPSEVRKSLDVERDGESLFILVGVNQRPWLYPEKGYETLVSQRASELAPGEDMLAFDQMNFAMTSKVEWDKQGRVVMPDKTLRRTGMNKEVTLIGVRDHLELWNRADWEAQSEQLLSRKVEIALRAKQPRPAT
jgi:MraZ protein